MLDFKIRTETRFQIIGLEMWASTAAERSSLELTPKKSAHLLLLRLAKHVTVVTTSLWMPMTAAMLSPLMRLILTAGERIPSHSLDVIWDGGVLELGVVGFASLMRQRACSRKREPNQRTS